MNPANYLRLQSIKRLREGLSHNLLATTTNSIFDLIREGESFSGAVENFPPNSLYGSAAIIRDHYQLGDSPLNIVIPHGVPHDGSVWSIEILAGLNVLCYSNYHSERMAIGAHLLAKKLKLIRHEHPFSLAAKQVQSIGKNESQSGCIYALSHSTNRFSALHDWESIKLETDMLRTAYGRVTCLVYYIDFMRLEREGNLSRMRDYFDDLVCCGHRDDPAFMANLARVILAHSAIFVEEIGSVAFYGNHLGLEVFTKKALTAVNIFSKAPSGDILWEITRRKVAIFRRSFIETSFGEFSLSNEVVCQIDRNFLSSFLSSMHDSEVVRERISLLALHGDLRIDTMGKIFPVIDASATPYCVIE
jgi:hypothetical protein